MINVVVVDDSVVVRRLIVGALAGARNIKVVGTARTSAYRVRSAVPAGAVRRG